MYPPLLGRKRARQGTAGQALVEFALVAPLFFILLIGVFEGARYILYLETLNHATREGARYAIVHGWEARNENPTGPLPGDAVYQSTGNCDAEGVTSPDPCGFDVATAVKEAALGLAASGALSVPKPCWLSEGQLFVPTRDTDCTKGNNKRGSPVTVFADFGYETIFEEVLGVDMLPPITISAETTLVVNN